MTPRRTLLAFTASAGILLALASLTAPAGATAPRWYCSTTTTVGQACIPDPTTTAYVTTTDEVTTTTAEETTTVPPTTIPPFCNPNTQAGCINIDGTTTTTIATTTTAAQTTTTAPPAVTTAPAETTLPPDTTTAPTTVAPVAELPHTGAGYAVPMLAIAGAVLLAGCALVLAGKAR